ncbi:hypothetical protein E1281_38035 [Actinomadura sp. KC345]|nr:hypothetical protein E1281_38035 [Actinomadura sp. KC345]
MVAAFLVFGAVIAVIAALVAPHVPSFAPEHSSGRTDPEPAGWFGAVLLCLLGGPAGVAWAGRTFSAPKAESEEDGRRTWGPLAAGFGFTGLLGVPALLLFVALLARQALPRGGLLPDGGGFFFVLGAVGTMGGLAAALVIAALRLFGGHRTRAAPPVGPLSPLAAAAYFAVLGLLGMQLAHALPVTGVRIIGFIAMLVSSPVTVLIIGRSMKQSEPR